MHMRGTEITFIDTMHVVLAATGAVFCTLAVGFGAFAFGKRFKFYSISTIVMLFAPAIVGFSYVPQVAANESSPWLGLRERLAFAVHMQWQITLAIVLLRKRKDDKKGHFERMTRY
jgi:hypothetical protein